MKHRAEKRAAAEEVIRLLDSGLPGEEVAAQFPELDQKDAERHLRLIRDLRETGQAVQPRPELLQAALDKISFGGADTELGDSRVTLVKNFIRRSFEARLFVPVGAIAIIAITIVSFRPSGELVATENREVEFAALMGAAPSEAPALMAITGDASVAGSGDSFADLFDEGAIARESARADADLAAAERFFAMDDDVQAALVNF